MTSPRQRPWISLLTSAAVHVLLLVLAVWVTRPKPEDMEEEREVKKADAEQREVQMVYLSPPPTPPPPPQAAPPPPPPPPEPKATPPPPRPVAPPPEKAQPTPEPDANAPSDAERSKGPEPKDDENDKVRKGEPEPPTSPLAIAEDPMAAEARRIFGRQKKFTPEGVGPRASRPMEAYLPDHPERCIPKQPNPDSLGHPQYGTVMGRIFRQDDGRPLGGAHLQMLGTPYVTFTDADGEYQFRFDLSLVDNCRTQYVRVTAAGYESRLLVLVVGPNARSEDVRLKKR